jgi:hypothetical protein
LYLVASSAIGTLTSIGLGSFSLSYVVIEKQPSV